MYIFNTLFGAAKSINTCQRLNICVMSKDFLVFENRFSESFLFVFLYQKFLEKINRFFLAQNNHLNL